jgi:hypothetical protein
MCRQIACIASHINTCRTIYKVTLTRDMGDSTQDTKAHCSLFVPEKGTFVIRSSHKALKNKACQMHVNDMWPIPAHAIV